MNDKTIDPVLVFKHPKALTSAFFSASGSNMVSTCNDDHIRIFNTNQLTAQATSKLEIYVYINLNYFLCKKSDFIDY